MISVCLYLLFTSFVTSSVFSACSSRSEWIFTKLCELLAPLELSIMMIVRLKKTIQKQSSFRWRNPILTRPPREHSRFQGSFIHIAYDSINPGHQYRSRNAFTSVPGGRRVRGSFSIILFLP